MNEFYSVAIDGPAGAGKSTIAKAVAKGLGFRYVDTGAIYRTVGYHMALMGIGPRDVDGITRLIDDVNLRLEYDDEGTQRMILNGVDVSEEIRTPEMSAISSQISAHAVVRDFLLDVQRDVARNNHVIMDGRDIGTVVLPHANVKIFLTAPVEVRARRRFAQLLEKDPKCRFETVLRDMERRDEQDRTRKLAPLKRAEDAILLDTGDMTLEESIEAVMTTIKERVGL